MNSYDVMVLVVYQLTWVVGCNVGKSEFFKECNSKDRISRFHFMALSMSREFFKYLFLCLLIVEIAQIKI